MPKSSKPILPDLLRAHFFQPPNATHLQAQFASSRAASLVEKDLAAAGVTYKTSIVKSKKRGVLYVITLPEQSGVVFPTDAV